MIEIKCKKCSKKWYVLDDMWMEVKFCPFCDEVIDKEYETDIESFSDVLKKIFLTQGCDILKVKKKFIAVLMDTSIQYRQEIKIIENFCSAEMLKTIYESRLDNSALDHEIRIIQLNMMDSGIAEAWAERIGSSFCSAIKETENVKLCLPNNFCKIDSSGIIGQDFGDKTQLIQMKEELSQGKEDIKCEEIEVIAKNVGDKFTNAIKDVVQNLYICNDDIADKKILELVSDFISQDNVICRGKGHFDEKSLDRLRNNLKVPIEAEVFLAHDDSVFKDGESGYILADKGIFSSVFSEGYLSWEKFVDGSLSSAGDCVVRINDKKFIEHVLGDKVTRNYVINKFFFELQKYIKGNC